MSFVVFCRWEALIMRCKDLFGLGSFQAPAELVEQQMIAGHDGRRPVVGERVCDVSEGEAQSVRHVGQHRGVQVLWTQPGV